MDQDRESALPGDIAGRDGVNLRGSIFQRCTGNLSRDRIEEEADKIVATGAPAQMQQQPEPDQPPVTARAGIIEYYKLEERVRLRKGARLEQEGSTFTGESIDYYMADQRVRATSNADDESSRVEVVIPARVLKEEAADGAPEGQ